MLIAYESTPGGQSYGAILREGGIVLQVDFNDGTGRDDSVFWAGKPGVDMTPKSVRGFPGYSIRIDRPADGLAWRRVAWKEPLGATATADWSLATHLDFWTDDDVASLIRTLTEVRPE